MAGELGDLLKGAAESKRQGFASEDFAGGYGRSVIGRVKRRRAVTATAMGGGTVVAVGAIAAGAASVPWSSFVLGADPASSPSVVCTTTTPDAVDGFAGSATRVLIDLGTASALFIGPVDGLARAWHPDGSAVNLMPSGDHAWDLTLPSGELVTLETGPDGSQFNIVATHGAAVSVLNVDEFLGKSASSLGVIAEDGAVLGRAIHISDSQLALVLEGTLYPLAPGNGLEYTYVDRAGESVTVTLVDSDSVAGNPEPAATATVTCVTTTPEPSESASPVPSPSGSSSPSASPSASPSEVTAAVGSPFYCGTGISGDEYGSDVFGVSQVSWVSAADANAAAAPYNVADGSPWHAQGNADVLRVVVSGSWFSSADIQNLGGGAGSGDPTEFANSANYPQASEDSVVEGLTFVAVQDGVVVATLPRTDTEPNPHVFVTTDEVPAINPVGYLLNPDDAWTSCDGETLENDWDLYAVAGATLRHSDGKVDQPMYAWKKIEPTN